MNGRVAGAIPVSGLHAPRSIETLVDEIAVLLSRGGVADSAVEARDLVAVVVGQNRFWPRVHADDSAPADLVARALAMANRRATGMPFAYAVRRAAFRHLALEVDERVLIPRQETEVLVDLVLRHCNERHGGLVADVGTGSGAIALALAAEGHFDRVIATDVAADAIEVARENARLLNGKSTAVVEFRVGDLLAPLHGEQLDVLVSNPPYIAFDEAVALPPSVRDWEPSHALFSGGQGLDATRKIIEGAPALLCPGGLLALEVDSRRALQVVEFMAAGGEGAFKEIVLHQDLMGRDRFVLATRS